jgi:hypothetical protein
MHLQAVLLLIYAPGHGLEVPLFLDLFDELSVDNEVAERGAILVAASRGGTTLYRIRR